MQISIIIATWNAGKTLRTCLDSIVPQLNNEVELIIIDGDSKDETNEIISSYGDKISYTISEPDKGIYDAWNKGVKVARGKWIAFIGADDVLLPDAIDKYLKCINSTENIDDYDFICAQNYFVDKEGNVLRVIGGPAAWDKMKYRNAIAHVASLHNRINLFDTYGGYNINFRISADYELLVRKRNQLKYIFIKQHIAKMKIGGMSYSVAALKEVYQIRKMHQTVSCLENVFLFVWDWLMFKTFTIRKKILK